MTFRKQQSGFSVIEFIFVLSMIVALAGALLVYPNNDQSLSIKQFQQEIHNAVFKARRISIEHVEDIKLSIDSNGKQYSIAWDDEDGKSHVQTFDIVSDGISDCKLFSIVEADRKKLASRTRNPLKFVTVRLKYCQPFELSFLVGDNKKERHSLFVDRLCQLTSTFPESMIYGQE